MERSVGLVTDVKDLSELLSGASVDQTQVRSAGGQLSLVLELTRALLERRTIVRRGPFRRVKTPWTKCELRLSQIRAVTVKRLADLAPDQAPLLTCEAIPGGYQLTIQAPDGLRFVLEVPQLEGSFADVGSLIESP